MLPPPAEIGARLEDVDTPALLIESAALERNLVRMAQFAARSGVALRAHAKTHKCPVIGLRQVELGARGLCCQKVSEAEAMVAAGIEDVLITNQVVGRTKLERLAHLAAHAHIGVCVDNAENVLQLDESAARHRVQLDVLVEINVGGNRCGVEPGASAVSLARLTEACPRLRFAGLQAYHGPAQHFREYERRRLAVEGVTQLCRTTREMLEDEGIDCPVITGAGTGTFEFEAASGIYTELQAGSYVFMDADYARNRAAGDTPFDTFEQSLFVWTTVMSRACASTAVVDAGLKAVGVDAGMPLVAGVTGAEYVRASDEHGTLRLSELGRSLGVGDKLRLIPGNCDPTVNLHDWYVVIQQGRVQALWPIAARGPGY